jgi:hypothetical protein
VTAATATATGPFTGSAPDWLVADIDNAIAQMVIQRALACLNLKHPDLALAAIDSLAQVKRVGVAACSTLGAVALSAGAPEAALDAAVPAGSSGRMGYTGWAARRHDCRSR